MTKNITLFLLITISLNLSAFDKNCGTERAKEIYDIAETRYTAGVLILAEFNKAKVNYLLAELCESKRDANAKCVDVKAIQNEVYDHVFELYRMNKVDLNHVIRESDQIKLIKKICQ